MPVKKGQELELSVTDIVFGGKGLCKIDGFAVFVDKTVPGDRVLARIVKKKKNFAEARVVEMISPSLDRVEAPCPVAGFCGGCNRQHLSYDKQLEYKTRHVIDGVTHIGLLENVSVLPTLPSPRLFGYRNKMEFSFSDRKWLLPSEMDKEHADMDFALGLHAPGTFYKVLDIDACLLQPDLGNDILKDIKAEIKKTGLPPYGLKSHEGFFRFIMLRNSSAHGAYMVNIVTKTENPEALRPICDHMTRKYPQITSMVNNITASKGGIAFGEKEILLYGDSFIRDKIGNYEFEISANSFFQTNTKGAEILYETVLKYADPKGNETVLDLYCGTGAIGIFLSGLVGKVFGIELVEDAVKNARKNVSANNVDNCEFFSGDMKDGLKKIGHKPDIMVIDPPRTGMHKDVVKQVLEMDCPKIVYVSCNPATLARDVALMKDKYTLAEVQPVDMFPHTYHIEAVGLLIKKKNT